MEIHVLGKHILHSLDHKPFRVNVYDRPYPSARMCLMVTNWSVRKIEIDELDPADPKLRNLDSRTEVEQLKQKGATTILVPLQKIDWECVPAKYR